MATVSSATRSNTFTTVSATAGPFNVGFRLFDTDALEVYLNGTRTYAFTISATFVNGYDDAATITFTSSVASGTQVIIDGSLTPRRSADYLPGDPRLVAKLNIELPRLWSALSEVKRDTGRSVRGLTPIAPGVTAPSPSSPAAGTAPYVILIMGQSNAAGVNSGGPNPLSLLVTTWDAGLGTPAWGGSDYTGLPWSRSTPNGNGGNNNYALARAHRVATDTGRPVYIVFDAVGGTSIDEWVASGTASTRYAAAKVKVEAALATLPGKTTVDEIIWAQGEEDFLDDFATHLGNLTLLRNQLRAETWCGYDTPIYFMGPSPLHDRYQWQNAYQYFCAKVDNRCIYVPSNGLRTVYQANGVTDTPGTGDFTHFLGESLWEAGYYRIADAAPVETAPVLFYGRGIGPASQADPTVLTTFSSLVSFNSWTGANSPTGVAATGSITWGLNCSADGNYSYCLGDNCVTDNVANYTILAGRDLSAGPDGDYCAGFGQGNVLASSYGFAAGRGHTVADDYGAAVGSFSEYTTAQADDVLFQVGRGTSGSPANAVAVRASGRIEAKSLPTHADNAAAVGAGLAVGNLYKTAAGDLRIVV